MAKMLTPPAAALALLFAAGEPLTKKELADLLDISPKDLASILSALRQSLTIGGLALIETGEEIEIRTSPEAAELVKRLWEAERTRDLGKAGLETLAVIAYHATGADTGGTTRGQIDSVRGVNSSASVRTLLVRGLIEGREDPSDKRRIRYSLTPEALAHLGLSRAEELPRYMELAEAAMQAGAESEKHDLPAVPAHTGQTDV
ncbi:MAG: SMC-Scp complex subunit ScpB [bacterium]|nr:SMC-Scp complex subunit ScpB [bacterium]